MLTISLFFFFLVFSKCDVFRNRLFTIGSNDDWKLCNSASSYFPEESEQRISSLPSNKEISFIIGTKVNYFMMIEDGEVFGSGDETYIGGTSAVPMRMDFSSASPSFAPAHVFCSLEFTTFCSMNFSECFGFGKNDKCQVAGCSVTDDPITSLVSIFTGDLDSFISEQSSSNSATSFAISNLFVGYRSTFVLFENTSSYSLFATGKNKEGLFGTGDNQDQQDWIYIDLPEGIYDSKIKFLSIFYEYTLYIVTEDNRWFFAGKNEYNTCCSYFTKDGATTSITEIPQDVDCYYDSIYKNDLKGKVIVDLQCSYYHCASLTNESKVYTWGTKMDYLGRVKIADDKERFVPKIVDMSSSFNLLEEERNRTFLIDGLYVQEFFTFVTMFDDEENRKRIFAFGKSSASGFVFEDYATRTMFEVFKDYNFTEYLTLSRGNFQSYSLMLLDTSICGGYYRDESFVCSGHGICVDNDNCSCSSGYWGSFCQAQLCYGIPSTSPSVCSGNGICIDVDNCSCIFQQEGVQKNCSLPSCFGYLASDPRVCSNGNGRCIAHDNCSCYEGYDNDMCQDWFCFGESSNSSSVCSNNGKCIAADTCNCTFNDIGVAANCSIPSCFGYTGNDSRVCSSNGHCLNKDECLCDEGFGNIKCEDYVCFDVLSSDNAVCSANGVCMAPDFCLCSFYQDGIPENCSVPYCFGYAANDSRVCSGNGMCVSNDKCVCEQGHGLNCTFYSCFGIQENFETVCSGNGRCVGDDDCNCDDEFFGEECQKTPGDGNSKLSLMTLLSIILPSFGVFLLLLLLICCCFFYFFCFIFVFLAIIVIPVAINFMKNKEKIKTFEGIRNIDLIMEEQKLEERVDIAHLRINKQLFQIQMKDIRLLRVIGEGGSNATVYLILWHGKKAAFKCFKTRIICSKQRNFDEFEKEVEILGSISHPNIIRFYGACLDPSRTGFVMEYCENGDLHHFLALKKKEHLLEYDLFEKIRMFCEIADAMSFLHAKKVIHRDLKPENVLLDGFFSCKLMDFGCSKFYESTEASSQMTKRVGTSHYMSPEVVLGRIYTKKVDVFSFGILMFVMLTEQLNPYEGERSSNIEYQVANNPSFRPKFKEQEEELEKENGEDDIPMTLQKLCQDCWSHNEDERPTFDEILGILNPYKGGSPTNSPSKKKKSHEYVSSSFRTVAAVRNRKINSYSQQKVEKMKRLMNEKYKVNVDINQQKEQLAKSSGDVSEMDKIDDLESLRKEIHNLRKQNLDLLQHSASAENLSENDRRPPSNDEDHSIKGIILNNHFRDLTIHYKEQEGNFKGK